MIDVYLAFAFVVVAGACVGSFLNVVIYRLPEGLSIVHPPSSCPKCGHRLAWHDNVPVLGWLWLRGRCRYCAAPISAQYPVVEAATALIFGLWFYVCYLTPLRPGFSVPPGDETAMIFAISLVLIGALIAATVIDARLYIIPLSITWLVTGVGVVGLTLAVWLFPLSVQQVELPPASQYTPRERLARAPQEVRAASYVRVAVLHRDEGVVKFTAAPFVCPSAGAAGFGGAAALALALVLLRAGVLKTSFADDADRPSDEAKASADADPPLESHDENVPQLLLLLGPIVGAVAAAVVTGDDWIDPAGSPSALPLALGIVGGYAAVVALMVVASLVSRQSADETADASDADDGVVFHPHPHTRREMMKELAFIAFPLAGMVIGSLMAGPAAQMPDALRVMGASLFGYLIGGGVVWLVRILGSLLFGKEAMGLGDVHLMGAVGAVCGWKIAMAAFFLAAFLGLAYAVLSVGFGRLVRSRGRQMPFGPQLAAATFVAMVWREPIATYFMSMF